MAYLAVNCRAKSVAPQERAVPEEGQRTAIILGSTRKIARRRRRRRREGGNETHFGRSRPSFGRSRTVRSNKLAFNDEGKRGGVKRRREETGPLEG